MARKTVARQSIVAIPARTFGYVRVSTDEQATNGQSLNVQRERISSWATERGKRIDRFIVEAGVSAWTRFNERPEGSKLWADLQPNDVIIITKIDRMFRRAVDCLNTVERLNERKVVIHAIDFWNGEAISGNGMAGFFLGAMALAAQLERDLIAERIREVKRAQKARGEYSGGMPPFGFIYGGKQGDKHRPLVPVPEQQAVIRRIKRLSAKGWTPRRIAEHLRERGEYLSGVTVRKVLAGR